MKLLQIIRTIIMRWVLCFKNKNSPCFKLQLKLWYVRVRQSAIKETWGWFLYYRSVISVSMSFWAINHFIKHTGLATALLLRIYSWHRFMLCHAEYMDRNIFQLVTNLCISMALFNNQWLYRKYLINNLISFDNMFQCICKNEYQQ